MVMDQSKKDQIQMIFKQGEDLELIEEHKDDYEEMGEMVPA